MPISSRRLLSYLKFYALRRCIPNNNELLLKHKIYLAVFLKHYMQDIEVLKDIGLKFSVFMIK